MLHTRFLSGLLGLLTVLAVATLAPLSAAAPPNADPVAIEQSAVARGVGGTAASQLLAAFLARDAATLERVRIAHEFDSITAAVHYRSGILDCPANPRPCERVMLSLYGWRGNEPSMLGRVIFLLEDLVPHDRAQSMRLERSSPAGITSVVERLDYLDGRFNAEVWLLIRPDENMTKGPPPQAFQSDQVAALKGVQRELLAQEGFNLANSNLNSDNADRAIPEVTRWFHLLGRVTPQNVTTIGPATMSLLGSMLNVDPVRDTGTIPAS